MKSLLLGVVAVLCISFCTPDADAGGLLKRLKARCLAKHCGGCSDCAPAPAPAPCDIPAPAPCAAPAPCESPAPCNCETAPVSYTSPCPTCYKTVEKPYKYYVDVPVKVDKEVMVNKWVKVPKTIKVPKTVYVDKEITVSKCVTVPKTIQVTKYVKEERHGVHKYKVPYCPTCVEDNHDHPHDHPHDHDHDHPHDHGGDGDGTDDGSVLLPEVSDGANAESIPRKDVFTDSSRRTVRSFLAKFREARGIRSEAVDGEVARLASN